MQSSVSSICEKLLLNQLSSNVVGTFPKIYNTTKKYLCIFIHNETPTKQYICMVYISNTINGTPREICSIYTSSLAYF